VFETAYDGAVTPEKYCTRPGRYCGLVFLTSVETGEPLAFIHDGVLQHMRVAGDGGIGVKYMAKNDASIVGMLGSGGIALWRRIVASLTDSAVPLLDAKLIEPRAHIVYIGGSLKPAADVQARVDVYLRFGDAPAPVGRPELGLEDEWALDPRRSFTRISRGCRS
jgi:alanine dehydrogenase